MFLTLWNYLRGYVIIQISGFSVERFINLAVHKGVYLWDVVRTSDKAEMKVSARAFKLLKPCAKKTKCKIKIAGRRGLPFVMFKYRKRKLLAIGVLFFIGFLFFLSSFVWMLDVRGNERLHADEIVEFLQEKGLAVGTFKYGVDTKSLEKELMARFDDISWINVYIKGTKATVTLTETIEKHPIVDKSTPCDIVASKDCLITFMATSAGTPKVKVGDVVQKGDVLVSGELLVGTDESNLVRRYVHAQSEVRGKMYYEMNFSVPFEYIVKNFTGKIQKDYSIIVFDKQINIFKPKVKFRNFETFTSRKQFKFGDDYPLPAISMRNEYREYVPQTMSRTVDEAKKIADSLLTNKIIQEFDIDIDILDKRVEYSENGGYLNVKATITTFERIDEAVELVPSAPQNTEQNQSQ